MSLSLRTIFLLIRGIDQTGRALSKPAKELKTLEERQAALAKSGFRLMFAGAAFAAFGAMATGALMSTLQFSTRGARYLNDFNTVMDRFKKAIGEKIVDNFGPHLESWLHNIEKITASDFWTSAIGGTGLAITLTLTVTGLIFAVAGVLMQTIGPAIMGAMIAGGLPTGVAVILGTVGTALLEIAVPIIVTWLIGKMIWEIMPDAWKDYGRDMVAAAEEYAGTNPVISGRNQISYPPGESRWDYGFQQPETFYEGQQGTANQSQVNLFIDELHTQADREGLVDLIREVWDSLFDASGAEVGVID